MNYYTMYKMLKCLARDPENDHDIREMIRQEIQMKHNCDIEEDKLDGTTYTATLWFFPDDEASYVCNISVDLKEIAIMLTTDEGIL